MHSYYTISRNGKNKLTLVNKDYVKFLSVRLNTYIASLVFLCVTEGMVCCRKEGLVERAFRFPLLVLVGHGFHR